MEIPRELWPPFPEKTHPELNGKEADGVLGTYYQAGIRTDYSTETWYGQRVVIKVGNVENSDEDTHQIFLTPHVTLKSSSDYIAVVSKVKEDHVEFWTFHAYEDPGEWWEYEGNVNKNSQYEYSLYIDSNNNYSVIIYLTKEIVNS